MMSVVGTSRSTSIGSSADIFSVVGRHAQEEQITTL